MRLSPGSNIGPYRIVSVIGAGGMGEVYRATDSKLGRDVAIKVLPDAVAADADRRARFDREARALAALNHFNIAQVYGVEDNAIVMELLDGESLRDRLKQGSIPTRKVIDYGAQIARGLAAAHDRGIIHRDLKPENIFIVADGHIKILDFGLARQEDAAGAEQTMTAHPSTAPGVVMGTVGYMSPEQVRGQQVDARSDVFSLGAVLYEMLAGQQPFRRDSHVETMTAILNSDPPDLAGSRPDINPAFERILRHCLEKNRVERFQSARDVAFALDSLSGSSPATAAAARRTSAIRPERAAWVLITVTLLALLGWSTITGRRAPTLTPAPVTRGLLTLPDGVIVNDIIAPALRLSLSPDGTRVAVHGRNLLNGQAGVFIVPLDGSQAVPLPETGQTAGAFWSPDSRSLFTLTATALMRHSLDGSAPIVVSRQLRNVLGTITINPSGDILAGGTQLRRLRAQDDAIEVVAEEEQRSLIGPQFLEDGKRFIVTRMAGPPGSPTEVELTVRTLGSKSVDVLMRSTELSRAMMANGMLVFSRGTNLFAQRVNGEPMRPLGDPVQIAPAVDTLVGRGSAFSVSMNGVLVYQPPTSRPLLKLTWVDRSGKVLGAIGSEADYSNLELSPDGRFALASITDPTINARDIYTIDLTRDGVRQRLTTDPSDERSAVWSPDGRRIIFSSKGQELYERNADGSGTEHVFLKDGLNKDPYDWSPDGQWVLYRTLRNNNDLWVAPAGGQGPGHAVVESRFSEASGNFSPDSKRVVYTSDESGEAEVYVVNLDGTGKVRISTAGGAFPRWRRDGKEIVYLSSTRVLMSVDVSASEPLTVSAPRALFQMNVLQAPGAVYDISSDGSKFLVASPVPSRIPPSVTVLTNWPRLVTGSR